MHASFSEIVVRIGHVQNAPFSKSVTTLEATKGFFFDSSGPLDFSKGRSSMLVPMKVLKSVTDVSAHESEVFVIFEGV